MSGQQRLVNEALAVELRERALITIGNVIGNLGRGLMQVGVDADIEGLARDENSEALMAQMDRDGVPAEEQIERLKAYFSRRDRLAAE